METAGKITQNILRIINMTPQCVSYRINNVGVWDAKKNVHRKGNTKKGIFDISAIVRGRAVWIEVKAGKDVPSVDQMIFKQEIERAGGIAFFVHSTDEFLKIWETLV